MWYSVSARRYTSWDDSEYVGACYSLRIRLSYDREQTNNDKYISRHCWTGNSQKHKISHLFFKVFLLIRGSELPLFNFLLISGHGNPTPILSQECDSLSHFIRFQSLRGTDVSRAQLTRWIYLLQWMWFERCIEVRKAEHSCLINIPYLLHWM